MPKTVTIGVVPVVLTTLEYQFLKSMSERSDGGAAFWGQHVQYEMAPDIRRFLKARKLVSWERSPVKGAPGEFYQHTEINELGRASLLGYEQTGS